MKSLLYKTFMFFYRLNPFKKWTCVILRGLKLPIEKLHRDLRFNGEFKVKMKEGSFKMVHYGGTIESAIFWSGVGNTFEADTIWLWKECCTFSNSIIDIGANTGLYSLIAGAINSSSKIIAFEPSRETYGRLLKNNKINGQQFECEQLAISDSNGNATFFDVAHANQTSASLSPDKLKNWAGDNSDIVEYSVETITLDNFVEKREIKNIDLIKIDVEMHEPAVIKGMTETLGLRPLIFIEVLTDEIGDQLNQLFKDTNYQKVHLKSKNEVIEVEHFSSVPYAWNYFLYPKERKAELAGKLSIF